MTDTTNIPTVFKAIAMFLMGMLTHQMFITDNVEAFVASIWITIIIFAITLIDLKQ